MDRFAVAVRRHAGAPLRGERWPAVVLILALASSVCIGLVAGRILLSRHGSYAFLIWNLVLAWVPLLLALAIWLGYRARWHRAALVALGALWLLFLPNAPYIVTDYVHLFLDYRGAPAWFDALSITAYAMTGLLLGFASLYLVQAVVRCALGEQLTWALVHATLALSSVGIYLGRYQRMNSWDAIRDPLRIPAMARERLADPLGNEALILMVVSFTAALIALYLLLYSVVLPRLEPRLAGRWVRR
jgi:uncharacterized membrane protein